MWVIVIEIIWLLLRLKSFISILKKKKKKLWFLLVKTRKNLFNGCVNLYVILWSLIQIFSQTPQIKASLEFPWGKVFCLDIKLLAINRIKCGKEAFMAFRNSEQNQNLIQMPWSSLCNYIDKGKFLKFIFLNFLYKTNTESRLFYTHMN